MTKTPNTFSVFALFTLYSNILVSNGNPLIGEKVQLARANEFPFIVSFGRFFPSPPNQRYLNHYCAGSLITRRHVLTSAHCLEDENLSEITVTVGSKDLNKGELYSIKTWISYDEWAAENNILPEFLINDMAVVTLSKEVTNIMPAVRSNLPENKIFGKQVVTAGWGVLINNATPQFLQKASLYVLTPKQCMRHVLQLFGTKDAFPVNNYCTAAIPPLITSCGDSGGPLLLKETRELIGVNQGACEIENPLAHPHSMSVHVKVNYFKDFIDDVCKQ